MNVPPILSTLLLLIFLCHYSSTVKNDRVGPSYINGQNFIRNSRRISLNEYLIPPPPPRHHSLRSGRVANPAQSEAPGYFSKLMNWLNPFNYGSAQPPVEPAFQPRGPPSFNLQPSPPLQPPPGPLYPPLGPPPNHPPDLILPHPPGVYPGPPLNLPPNPSVPVYNAPPAILHNVQPSINNPGPYPNSNKGRSCNPCNKIPWIPMQGGGLRSDEHPPHPQLSNGYLPPSNPINHDNQHSASHEISVPSISQLPIGQNPLTGPQSYPGPVLPYDGPPLNPHAGNQEHFETTIPTSGQEHNPGINGHFNIRGNVDLASSGTRTDQGQLSSAPQSYGTEIDKRPPGPPQQEYRDSSIVNHANQQVQDSYPGVTSYGGSSDYGNQESNLESNVRYVTSFGSSNFNDQNQYSDDLSPSSSVIKDSQIPRENNIHFEQSPLLDLSKTEEWPTSTTIYNTEVVSDSTSKTTTDYGFETDNIFYEDSSNFIKQNESYSLSDIQNINGAFETATPPGVRYRNEDVEASTINTPYQPPGLLWSNFQQKNESLKNQAFLDSVVRWNHSFGDNNKFEKQENSGSWDTTTKQQGVKRNKQVQVVIPYTSEYTPIPFQQSYNDWSVKTNFEKSQPRKVPSSGERNIDNYVQQESRNDIRVINNLQSLFNINDSNRSNVQPIRTPTSTIQNNTRNFVSKASNSIDVRRLQKNIDNWTIQEYSKPTTSNAVLQSSTHPYLLPSKNIPAKYLTTTEPGESNDHNENVKTYSLAGFSFNEVEHEGSASNHVEETRTPDKVLRVETSKTEDVALESTNKSSTEEASWKSYSVSISPVDKERVYVVTPQSTLESSIKDNLENKSENSRETNESKIKSEENNGNFSEFETIEKAYQVLPQAVNNLAVASTGKENIPLWGIMEHEEFASLNLDETGDGATGEGADGPVLYSGHSKVSRGKR